MAIIKNIRIELDTRELRDVFFEYANLFAELKLQYSEDPELCELVNGDIKEAEEDIYKRFEKDIPICVDYR